MRTRKRWQAGVTAVELAVVTLIAAILGSIAIPQLGQLRRNAARTAVLNDLFHTVHFARSEAIKRNAVVSICRSVNGINCANALPNWNDGWIVFVNIDRDQPADIDPDEPILSRHSALSHGTLTSNRDSFSFRPFSQADVTGTLVYCVIGGTPKDARAIIISHTGRPRTSNRDANGKQLKC